MQEIGEYDGENWLDADADWDVVKNTVTID